MSCGSKKTAFYAGLIVLAALGVIDPPLACVIALGHVLHDTAAPRVLRPGWARPWNKRDGQHVPEAVGTGLVDRVGLSYPGGPDAARHAEDCVGMSSYRDKHPHQAECTRSGCAQSATKLALIGGRPCWLCAAHYGELTARQPAVR